MKDLTLIIERAVAGDNEAFTELCKAKGQSIVYLCIKNMGNIQDGEDAAQEVFIRLQKEIHSLKNVHAFDRWLYLMIQSTCNNLRKKNIKPTQNVSIDEFDNFIEEENLEYLPQDLVENTESRENMLNMINEMPKNMRMCVILFYYEGIFYAEIASVLSLSVNSVKAFLYQARLKMREKVEKTLSESKNNYSAVPIVLLKDLFKNDAATIASESIVSQCIASSLAIGTAVAAGSTIITTTAVTSTVAGGLATVLAVAAGIAVVLAGMVVTIVSAENDVTSNSSLVSVSQSVPQHFGQSEQGVIEDIYTSEESFVVDPSQSMEEKSSLTGESQNSTKEDPDSSPVKNIYTITGKIVIKDGSGNELASEDGNLTNLRLELVSDGKTIAQTFVKKDGSYKFEYLNLKQKEYEIKCFYIGGNGIDFKEKESIAYSAFYVGEKSSIEINEMYIYDIAKLNVVLMFYDKNGNGQFTNPYSMKLYISEPEKAGYVLQIYKQGDTQPVLTGDETSVNDFLRSSPTKGTYTLKAIVTDVAKNETTVELNFYIV